jgi:hypothetical protein
MIKILDSVMGTGKTTGVFKMMRDNPNKKYLYIGLFIQEVGDGNTGTKGRIQKELPDLNFKMPKNTGEGKLEGLKRLVRAGSNIASTHSLFSMFDLEVVDLLVENQYFLIIDEAVDAITTYKNIRKSDIDLMVNTGIVSKAEDGKISWCGDSFTDVEYDGKFLEVKELCALGSLYWYDDEVLIWEYPPKLLLELEDVLVITYLFEGSIMSSWMKVNQIPYSYVDNDSFGLVRNDIVMQVIRENLEIVVPHKLKAMKMGGSACGVNWYDKKVTPELWVQMKKVLENFVDTNSLKVGEVFWTTFLNRKTKLEGKGFTRVPKNGLSPFLAYNTKATNDYMNYKACMYAVNVFKTPTETGYLSSKGIEFDQDQYALSMMVQFLWRGCIRKGEPMKVLILSERMRNLLEGWLNG